MPRVDIPGVGMLILFQATKGNALDPLLANLLKGCETPDLILA